MLNWFQLGGLTTYVERNTAESVYDTCDGDLTFLGRLMSQLPVPHQCVRLIMLGHAFGVLKESVIIGERVFNFYEFELFAHALILFITLA